MATRKSELVITCNAKGVQNVMNFLNEKLGSIKQRLQEINSEASKNGWTDQLEKEFKQLTQEATGIDNIINRNQETMKKYGEVMKDLAGSKLRDLKKALQEGKQALNKMTEDDPGRTKLVGDLEKIARQMKNIQSASVSMKEAVRNLKDLGNISFDKLTHGLDAINQRLTSTKLKDKDRTKLQGFAQQYQAEIAYRQSQTAVTNRNVGSLNAQQLRSEQSALNSAMAAMSGVAGYEKYMAKYELRLKEVNQQLAILSEKEKKAAEDARRLAQTQQAAKTVQAVYRGQKVSLEDLQTAYKTLEQRATEYAGVNQAKFSNVKHQIDMVRGAMMELGAIRAPQTGASLNRIIGGDMTTASKDQLQVAQRQLQSMLTTLDQMPGKAKQADVVRTALKNITTQLNLVTEAEKRAEAQAKELQATQQAAKTVQAVYRGQAVSLEELNTAYKTLEARAAKYNGVNPAKFKTTQQQMKALEAQIKRLNGTLLTEQQLQDRIAHSGKYSVKQLQEAYNQLQAKLNTLHTNEHVAIRATQRQMKALQQEINRATGQVSGFAKAWQTAKQNIMMYVGVFAIVNKVKSALSGLVSQNKELSDSMANIRKVSQWASADVVKLTENLAKIDTRNTITTLQNLAYQGAKLGIGQYGVEGLSGFVRAAEQVQTALGEDLGEDALPALAKLTEVMGLIPKMGVEQAMQRAGSAIYQLGASSTATGKNIVEFSKRLMGLANVSGVTADELLGLGSAADSMALMPEVAATAFNKLFNSIHSNTEGIAKAVGIAKEELEGLLYEGRTMDALVKVFEKMQTMSMKELEGRGVFKELGSDGTRLTNVMITMANKVDMLRFHLETSNKAFSEGKAIINEYLIQQETAAAYFDRAANIWTKAFVNPEGVDIVKQLAQEWYNVSWEMTHSASTMAGIKITLEALAGTVKMLITYLPTLVQLLMCYGVGASLQAIFREFQAIYAAATMAGTATARLNALLKTNAAALAITGVLMLVAKYWELAEAEKAVAAEEEKRQHIFSDAAAEAIQTYNKQKEALDKYHDALRKSNSTEEERNEIIRQFKGEFGSYLEKLGIEIKTYQDMENALHRVNKELKDKAYYETGQKLRESYVGDAKQAQTNALSKFMQAAQKYNIPTTLMEDIVEGKITTIEAAMEAANQGMTNLGNKWGWEHLRDEEAERANRSTFGKMRDNFMDFFGGSPAEQVTTQRTQDIYHAVNDLLKASNEVRSRDEQVDKFIEQYADKYSPNISVEGAIGNLKRLKELNEDKLNEGLNVLRDEWKKMSETERGTDRGKQIGSAIDQYSKQIRSMRGEGYEAPPTAKEIAKQQSEAKQRMRKDMKDAQEASTGIISKLEEYYRLQETAISEARADGKLTEDQAKEMVRSLNIFKNESLATARRAITTGETEDWDKLKTTILPAVMSDTSEVSRTLLDTIQKVVVEKLHDDLAKFNGSKGVFGLSSRAFFDQMRAKAAGNEREAARLKAKIQNEVEKSLLQYHFVDQAVKQMRKDFETMGFVTETYEQWAKRMQEGVIEKPDIKLPATKKQQQARQQMTAKFATQELAGTDIYPEDMVAWFKEFTNDGKEEWVKTLPELEKWVNDTDKYKKEIDNLYHLLNRLQIRQNVGNTPGGGAQATQQVTTELDEAVSGTRTISDKQAFDAMGKKFIDQGVISYNIDIENKDSITKWLLDFTKDAEGNTEEWVSVFPKLLEWLKKIGATMEDNTDKTDEQIQEEQRRIDEIMPEMQQFYNTLMQWEGRYYDAQKKAYDLMQKRFDEKWAASGYDKLFKSAEQGIDLEGRRQKLTGKDQGVNFGEQAGFLNIENDPEVQMSLLRMAQRQKEFEEFKEIYEQRKLLGEDLTAFNEGLAERQRAIDEAEMAMQESLMNHINEHISKLEQWRQPIEQFGADVGTAMGEALASGESMAEGMQNALKSLVKSWGESTIQILKDLMMQQLRQKLVGKMMVKQEKKTQGEMTDTTEEGGENRLKATTLLETGTASVMQTVGQQMMQQKQAQDTQQAGQDASRVTGETMMGIAGAAARIMETLGPWGAPLIAVVTALLMGLLSMALGALGGGSKSGGNESAAKTKVKLKSGMLTYDEGNVQTVVGDDGRVYRAREQRSLPEGVSMVTEPIATRVNGQQALVGERGPEIVIGRKTTRAIQMNRPDLLRDLAMIDRGITTRKVRTFDEGNISDMATAFAGQLPAPQQSADGQQGGGDAQRERDQAMLATLGVLSQTIGQLQQQLAAGIHAEMNMFGDNGAYKKFQQADKFYKKYGG